MSRSLPSELSNQDPLPPPRYTLPLFPVRVTYVFMVINGLIFVADFIFQRYVFSLGALVPGLVLFYNQWWRLLTAGFIHADIIHVAVNLYALYNLGPLVERFYGSPRYSGIYIATLFGASVLVTLFSPMSSPTVGASGAIMGILGAALTYFWHYRNLLPQGRRYLGELVKMAFINVGIGLLPGISMWGHLGGLLVGLVMGWILLPHYQAVGQEVRVLHVRPVKQRVWVYTLVVMIVQLGVVFLAGRLRTG